MKLTTNLFKYILFSSGSRWTFLFVLLLAILGYGWTENNELILTEKTQNGNIIRCYKKGDTGKKILLIGSIHGNEKAGIILSAKILNEIFSRNNLRNTLLCIPCANPDGGILDTRMNASRIDINRNFPSANWVYTDSAKLKKDKKEFWGGMAAASEKETKFILEVDSIYQPEIIIVFHQFLDLINYDGKGLHLAEYIALKTGMKLESDIGYETPGSMGSYFGIDRKREIITIELPENPPDSLQQNLIRTIVGIVENDSVN